MPRKTKDPLIDEKISFEIATKGKKTTKKAVSKSNKVSTGSKVSKSKSSSSAAMKSKKTSVGKVSNKKKSNSKLNMDYLTEYYDLPCNYNKTVVKILAQTPKTLFVYWEISDEDKSNYIKKFGNDFFTSTRPVLIITNKTNNYSFEIEINDFANSWYFNVEDEACEYSVELGRRPITVEKSNLSSSYVSITTSNGIESPNGHILFEKASNTVYFKNIKTQASYSKNIANLQFMKKMVSGYNLSAFYKRMYKSEDIFDINNPTSK